MLYLCIRKEKPKNTSIYPRHHSATNPPPLRQHPLRQGISMAEKNEKHQYLSRRHSATRLPPLRRRHPVTGSIVGHCR
ncbi:MAG: hypothetical protein K5893_07960, partial [Prevotella sp.]|nr:hypothetical protein [Prevotella sp.]